MAPSANDALLARLRGLFREELQDNVRVLAEGMAELEQGPPADRRDELVHQLFRAAHSLKGAAHAAGVQQALEPCQRLEDLLARLRSGQQQVDAELRASFAADLAALAELDLRWDQPPAPAPAPPPATGPSDPAPPGGIRGGDGPDRGGDRPDRGGTARARVAVAALDELLDQAGSLLASSRRLHTLTGALRTAATGAPGRSGDTPAWDRVADEAAEIDRLLSRAAEQVARSALGLRLLPVAEVTTGFDHVVADLAARTGKEVRLVLRGGHLELDREVATALREPLLHLLRNAVDHGIEPPAVRRRLGKPAVGEVAITATPAGDRLHITVADDGAGVDLDALRDLAGDPTLGSDDALEVAFRPGVSTAATVTEVSGRGVGLDAVRTRVEALGGSIHLTTGTPPASGTQVQLVVPLTLAVVRVLFVAAGDQVVAVPSTAVQRLWRIDAGDVERVGGRLVLRSEGEPRRVVPLASALGFGEAPGPSAGQIVLEVAQEDGLLLVDAALGEEESLLHPLPDRVRDPHAMGAVVAGTDRATLVVNPATCLRTGARLAPPAGPTGSGRSRPTILLAEDTLTTRALEHSILAGAGYRVLDAADGAEAWQLLTEHGADLVVSDVDMPNLDGIDLCRAIRSSVRFRDLPVVLVTSLGSDEDRRRGVEAGADAYLVKSAFDQAALLDTVRRLL